MGILGKGGLVLLSMGGCSGILMYMYLERQSKWAGIKNFARLRQGHVDALVVGGIFLAVEAAGVADAYASWLLLVTGFYTVVSTGAMGWWPDLMQKSTPTKWVDFLVLSNFALAWVWLAFRALTGW